MIFQTDLPGDMRVPRALPGMQPVSGPWFVVDEAYAGQMALRRQLIRERYGDVVAYAPGGRAAADELYAMMLEMLPGFGFEVRVGRVRCPDGEEVTLDPGDPMASLGALVQCDLCLMEKADGAEEHHLAAAVLCFPAYWTLREKIGRPLVRIHQPVTAYDAEVGRRVQRLFDGVQAGRPLWRFNRHFEANPEIFTPMTEAEKFGTPRKDPGQVKPYLRSERQTVLRLPETRAVLFAIHTYMLRREDVGEV